MLIKELKKYYTYNLSGSFSALSGFHKNNVKIINQSDLKLLNSDKTVALHRPIRKKFKRARVIVKGIDDEWQVDLIDVRKIKGSNYQHNYILTCIDVFSKYAWVVALKNKTAESTKKAFEDIIKKNNRKPNYIYLDAGREFLGVCKEFLSKHNIQIVQTRSLLKASVIKRFNRTLKEKMWRMFTFQKIKKIKFPFNYTRHLEELVES
jgi:hypothetical protein